MNKEQLQEWEDAILSAISCINDEEPSDAKAILEEVVKEMYLERIKV